MTHEHSVKIPVKDTLLSGILHVPQKAKGIVLFAHGSGSSRFSPRNQFVAKLLREQNIATLLFDLLTKEEEAKDLETAHIRFDIPLLSHRLEEAGDWICKNELTRHLSIGYFGSSTGAAAALMAAARKSSLIKAVVSRGGRPDLAGKALSLVTAPTLLIVGGEDKVVIELNQKALKELKSEKKLEIIPGSGHLFEEEGALEKVAKLAADWFNKYF